MSLTEKLNNKWTYVVGLENAEQALHEAMMFSFKFPYFFTIKCYVVRLVLKKTHLVGNIKDGEYN